MEGKIRNRVEESGIIQFDLSRIWPKMDIIEYDIANDLWQGIALKEKDFRYKVRETDWSQYDGKYVALHCSEDAIVPVWAYMLITAELHGHATKVVYGNVRELNNVVATDVINSLDLEEFKDGRIIIKGCSDLNIDESAYVELMNKLQPVAKSIMFGEPCSTVPLFKRR